MTRARLGGYRRRGLVWALAAAAAMVMGLAAYAQVRARQGLARGEALAAEGRILAAVYTLGAAARLYVPGFPTADEAIGRLEAIAHDGTVASQIRIVAHREVRRSLLGRGNVDPSDPRLRHTAQALGLGPEAVVPGAREGAGRFVRGRAAAASVAFLLWVVSTFQFLRRGLGARLELRPPAVAWGVAWILSLLSWAYLTRFTAD